MRIAILFTLVLAAAGCDNKTASTAPADNTKVNERDRNTAALTPKVLERHGATDISTIDEKSVPAGKAA